MGFFGNLFKRSNESIALIDIGSRTVGAGLAAYKDGKPTLVCSVRIPIQTREGEDLSVSMLRALGEANELLIRRGSGPLRQITGSGTIHGVDVSLTSPWEKTSIRVNRIDEQKPFTFSRSLMQGVVERTSTITPGAIGSEESVISVILNGYETNKPFGKQVKRADIVVLSSSIENDVVKMIVESVRAAYHTHSTTFNAFAPLAYTIFRDVYPHEKEFLIFDVSGLTTDISFIKQNLLMAVMTPQVGITQFAASDREIAAPGSPTARNVWTNSIAETLKVFSEGNPLPRTLFLLADNQYLEALRRAIDDPSLRALWLSDEPLSIIPVVPSHFSPFVSVAPEAESDIFLMMLALFHGKKIERVGG